MSEEPGKYHAGFQRNNQRGDSMPTLKITSMEILDLHSNPDGTFELLAGISNAQAVLVATWCQYHIHNPESADQGEREFGDAGPLTADSAVVYADVESEISGPRAMDGCHEPIPTTQSPPIEERLKKGRWM